MKKIIQLTVFGALVVGSTSLIGCAARNDQVSEIKKGKENLNKIETKLAEQGCSFTEAHRLQAAPLDLICKDLEEKSVEELAEIKTTFVEYLDAADKVTKRQGLSALQRDSIKARALYIQDKIVLVTEKTRVKKGRDEKLAELKEKAVVNGETGEILLDQELVTDVSTYIQAAKDQLTEAGCVSLDAPMDLECSRLIRGTFRNVGEMAGLKIDTEGERTVKRMDLYFEKIEKAKTTAQLITDSKSKIEADKALKSVVDLTQAVKAMYQDFFEQQTDEAMEDLISENVLPRSNTKNAEGEEIEITKELILSQEFTVQKNMVDHYLREYVSGPKLGRMKSQLEGLERAASLLQSNIKKAQANGIEISEEAQSSLEVATLLLVQVNISKPQVIKQIEEINAARAALVEEAKAEKSELDESTNDKPVESAVVEVKEVEALAAPIEEKGATTAEIDADALEEEAAKN